MTQPGSYTSLVLRGASLASGGYVATQLLLFGSLVALARLATPEDFGTLAAASVAVGVGSLVAESGMRAALIHRGDRLPEAANTALLATLAAGAALSLVALALAPLIGRAFGSDQVTAVAAAASGLLLLRAASIVPDALMQRRFSFVRRLVVEPAGALAFGVAGIVACAHGLAVWGLLIALYANAAVQLVATWLLARWRPRPGLASVGMWRELARYGRHVVGSELVRRVGEELDVLIVGRALGTGPLGLFRNGFRVAVQPLGALVNGSSYAIFPALARIAGDERRFRAAVLRALRLMCLLAFPLSLLLLPLGEPALVLLLGEQWRGAGQVVAGLCAYSAGHAIVSIASEVAKASGRPQQLTRMHAVSVALAALGMGALVPFGLLGAAIGLSLSAVGAAAYALRAIGQATRTPVRAVAGAAWPPALAAVVPAVTLLPLERWVVDAGERAWPLGVGLVAVQAVLGLGLYAAVLAAVAPQAAREAMALARRALAGRRRGARVAPPVGLQEPLGLEDRGA